MDEVERLREEAEHWKNAHAESERNAIEWAEKYRRVKHELDALESSVNNFIADLPPGVGRN